MSYYAKRDEYANRIRLTMRDAFINQMCFITDMSQDQAGEAFDTLGSPTSNIREAQWYCEKHGIESRHMTHDTMQQWLIDCSDNIKLSLLINSRIPHSWFNVLCEHFDTRLIQEIGLYKLFTGCDLGHWDHGGKAGNTTTNTNR